MPPNRTIIILMLAMLPIAGSAQELPAPDDIYHVEVVVFAREVPMASHYRHPGEPDARQALDILAGDVLDESAVVRLQPSVQFWPVALSKLTGVLNKLERLSEYRPIVDAAWEQTAVVFGESRPVRLYGGEVVLETDSPISLVGDRSTEHPITEVNGTATLERGRFVHLAVDVAYHRPQARRSMPAPMSTRDPFDAEYPYQTHRITERRQITLGEVQYFDHAQFGVLALVEKVEPRASAND